MKIKQMGKKGIFLTFIAISLVAAFIIIFTPSDINLRRDIPVVESRVTQMNDYVLDLENVYLERVLESTGTKAFIALIRYMRTQEEFLTDFDAAFKEVLLNGTIGNQPIDDVIDPDVMTGNNYNDWLAKILTSADDAFNLNTNFETIHAEDIKVYQIKPFFVNIDANITFNVSSETASWKKSVKLQTEIIYSD